MEKLATGLSRKAGMIPGTLVHVGDLDQHPVRLTLINYDADHVVEREITSFDDCFEFKDAKGVTWVNIEGVHDVSVIERIGECFAVHPLIMEDVMNTEQRPKLEEYEGYLYVVVRMLYERPADDEDTMEIDSEQVSFIVGPNILFTFLEDPGDVFDPVRKRIRENRGRVRKHGTDYLAYALIDVVVDNYFTVLERFGDLTEDLEQDVMGSPTRETLLQIQQMKRAMIQVRRSVWPLRDVVNTMLRGGSPLIKKPTMVYLRDVYDHVIRVVDIVETQREMLGGLMDIYLSSVSNRMNEVMKVLTVIATVFIPLTFIAGVYGMNFDNMPELHWVHGYWYVWAVMLAVALVMLLYFRRRRWF
ncbi:MAG: magnesium transporter [Gemmatimonas sp. SG8_28]|jgi:magnesium transporter|nr:MAG: magnesium transporter [Gemmatimonas sp. SG8_28]